MNCPLESSRNPDLLVELSTGRWSSVEFERHVASCPKCAEFCRAQQAVWTALDRFEAAPVSRGFNARLFERIEREERRGFWSRLFPARPFAGAFRPAAPIAIASVLALAVLLLQSPHRAPVQQQAMADVVDAESIEQTVDDLDMIRQLSAPPQADSNASQPM